MRSVLLKSAIYARAEYMLEGRQRMTTLCHHEDYLPAAVAGLENPQTDIPRIAKDKKLLSEIDAAVQQIPIVDPGIWTNKTVEIKS